MTTPACRILITGAGSGLGRGLSQCLAQAGHSIIATDLRPTGEARALDVTSETDVHRFLEGLEDPRIDVLINNAGLQHVARVEEFPPAKWDLLTDVIVKGTFLMTQALLPRMRAQGFGRLIHIGSIHSLAASPGKSAYVAAKHALLGFSKAVALETGDVDITSNTICPAYIRTPLVEAQIRDQARLRQISEEEVIQRVMLEPMPKKAFITVEEIAATCLFLMSAEARNITAQAIAIDGGWTAQ